MATALHYAREAMEDGEAAQNCIRDKVDEWLIKECLIDFRTNVKIVSQFSPELAIGIVSYFQNDKNSDARLVKTCKELRAKISSVSANQDLRATLTPGAGENVTAKPAAAQQLSST